MVLAPNFFAFQTAQAGAQVAASVASQQVQPRGTFVGELGGLIGELGSVAIQTTGDILRLRAQAEANKAAAKYAPRVVPGELPAATQPPRYLPTEFRPMGSPSSMPPPSSSGAGFLPVVLIGGGVLLVVALLVKRRR